MITSATFTDYLIRRLPQISRSKKRKRGRRSNEVKLMLEDLKKQDAQNPFLLCFDMITDQKRAVHIVQALQLYFQLNGLEVDRANCPDVFEWQGQLVSNWRRNKLILHLKNKP